MSEQMVNEIDTMRNIGEELVAYMNLRKNYRAISMRMAWRRACDNKNTLLSRAFMFCNEYVRILRFRDPCEKEAFKGVTKGIHPYDVFNSYLNR